MAGARGRVRRWVAGAVGVVLLVPVTGAAVATARPGPTAPAPDSSVGVEAEVRQELEADGTTDFWVRFEDRPDSAWLRSIEDWDARGEAVVAALRQTAEKSQAEARSMLDARGVDYTAYWATNAIHVSAGDSDMVAQLIRSPEVEGIYTPRAYDIPDEPVRTISPAMAPAAVGWGITDINADDVWSDYGITGEGLVVASIDTGVQYDHPALVDHYRGNDGDGTFTHDYNWFDPSGSPTPVDYNGHGTHVTGTLVGDDGAGNQIGVAPGATWITAAGCCPSEEALIDSGQWMLAPTRTDGSDPDPARRPHIINNSWATEVPSNDPFMEDVIVSWADAGIFGVFANGNSGPGCNTSASPGSRIVAYSVGNHTSSHTLGFLSSRGAGQDGAIKPDISAPGSDVRSSVPFDGYALISGTSMASPHVAGAVALLWSAAPGLVGDVEGTRALLDGTAVDTAYDLCGGTVEDNNGFGEGRLDVLAAVESVAVGTLSGTVTDVGTGEPVVGATVTVQGEVDATLTTGAGGSYELLRLPGAYDVTVSMAGYHPQSAPVTVALDGTTVQDFALLDADCEPGQPGPCPSVERVGGANRFGTAALLAQEYSSPGAVFVASGQSYADALSAAARAGTVDSPVLLVATGTVPDATAQALQDLDAASVFVVGGTAAVSEDVFDQVDAITGATPITRVWGADRFGTAAAISALFGTAETVYVASGMDYPDALAAAARAGDTGSPVLLVGKNSLPQATVDELARLAPEQIVLLGGTAAVSTTVEEALGAYGTVTRVGGSDRFETAALLAESLDASARVLVASGQNFPDALAGAAVAGRDAAPMLLTGQTSLPPATAEQVTRLQPELVTVVGGTAVITEAVLDALRAL